MPLSLPNILLLKKEALAMQTEPPRLSELKELARRKERIADQVTSLKSDMKRILSVTFPELETITGVFTKSMLRLLAQYPSAHAMLEAGTDAVAAIIVCRSRGQERPLPSRPSWTPPLCPSALQARQRT